MSSAAVDFAVLDACLQRDTAVAAEALLQLTAQGTPPAQQLYEVRNQQ
jgi:DNA polymerase III delta subunit